MINYLTYVFMTIASALLVILLSLSSCSPTLQTTTSQSPVMEHPKTTPSQTPVNQIQTSPKVNTQVATTTIRIHNFKFEPASVAISTGETVQFINVDEEPHTAISTEGTFNSKVLDTNETWNYTATVPGTFSYICSIHPFMKGTLTVIPKKN